MSEKRNSGRQFSVDLFDDDTEDDFDNMEEDVENFTLAELFTQVEVRRAGLERRDHEERKRRDREEHQIRRSQTEENTLSNSGTVILYMVPFFLLTNYKQVPKLLRLKLSFPLPKPSVIAAQPFS